MKIQHLSWVICLSVTNSKLPLQMFIKVLVSLMPFLSALYASSASLLTSSEHRTEDFISMGFSHQDGFTLVSSLSNKDRSLIFAYQDAMSLLKSLLHCVSFTQGSPLCKFS